MDDTHKFRDSLSEEGRYRLLVEAVTDYAIYMLDPTGRVTSWNAGAQRFKGYAQQEILGEHFSRFYSADDRAAGKPEKALDTARTEGRFEGEGWRIRKDGSRFWAHVVIDPIRSPDGELFGFAKITRDLTDRRAAELALRRTQEQFRLLVQGVVDYAIYMLDIDGFVSSWNSGAERIKGYLEHEILGQHFSRFYTDADRAAGQPAITLGVAARDGRYEAEGWRVRKDGSHFWAHVVIDALRDEAGQVIGFAKVTRDITAKREAQHALEQARESLFQSQKLDAIGQLTGGVAHDFNNLLMVIMSSLEILRRRVGDDPRSARLMDNAAKAAQRGASLTQRMLSFARRQDLKPTAVDTLALVQGMADMLRRALGPSISLSIPADAALPPATVDANQLELALLNLSVNARDAMPHGGRIAVGAGRSVVADGRADGAPQTLADGVYIVLSVTDDGAGMDADTLLKATEPFFTTKGVGKGTGLGLSMVQGLAVQSGGQLRLSSRPGHGTRAELWLPVAGTEEARAEDPARPQNVLRPASALNILVVDDDDLVLANTVALLDELGHTTSAASSPREAQAILGARPGFQVLLTDYAMPGMTGVELIEAARRVHPALVVVLATGYADLGSSLPEGVLRLTKPFGFDELTQVIQQARLALDGR